MPNIYISFTGRSQLDDAYFSPPPRVYENYPTGPGYTRAGVDEHTYWLPIWASGTQVTLRRTAVLNIFSAPTDRFVNADAYPTLSDGGSIADGTAAFSGMTADDWFIDCPWHLTQDWEDSFTSPDKWGVVMSYAMTRRRAIVSANIPGGSARYLAVLPMALRAGGANFGGSAGNARMAVFQRQYLALRGDSVNLPGIAPIGGFTIFPGRAFYQATDVHMRALGTTYQSREMALLIARATGIAERSGPQPHIAAVWRDDPANNRVWVAIRHAKNRRIVPSKPGMASPNNYLHGIQAPLMIDTDPWSTETYTRGFTANSEVFDTSMQSEGITKIRFTYASASLPSGQLYLSIGKSWPRGTMTPTEADGADGQYGWPMMELSNAQTYKCNRSYADLLASLSSEPAGVFFLPVRSDLGIPVQASDPGTYPGTSVDIDGTAPPPTTGSVSPGTISIGEQSGSTRTVAGSYSTTSTVTRVQCTLYNGASAVQVKSSAPVGGQGTVTFSGVPVTPTNDYRIGYVPVRTATSSSFTVV